jgi:hypothetical protein
MSKSEKNAERRKVEEFYTTLMNPLLAKIVAAFPAYFSRGTCGFHYGDWHKPEKRFATIILDSKQDRLQAETSGDIQKIETMLVELVAELNATLENVNPIELHVGFADMDAINAAGGFRNYFN